MSSESNRGVSKYDSSSDDDSRIRIENWESDEDERQLIQIHQSPLLIEGISSGDSGSAISNRTNSAVPNRHSSAQYRIRLQHTQNVRKKHLLPRNVALMPMSIVSPSDVHKGLTELKNIFGSAQTKSSPWLRSAVPPIKPSKKSLFNKSMGAVTKENSKLKVSETQIEWDALKSSQNSQNIANHASTLPAIISLRMCRSFSTTKTQPKSYIKKCCRDGGFVQQLQRALATAKTDRKYLEHDKKIGLQVGTLMRVRYMEASFGVYVATVQIQWVSKDCSEDATIRLILDADMASNVKIGSTLEAFITNDTEPYVNGVGTEHATATFVHPFKLMLF